MGSIFSHIPGFRTGTPRHMVLAGAYYVFSLSMMLVSVSLGFLLLSGPFLLFSGHAALGRYAESKNAKALTALLLSATICGGSLIGFVMDMTGRQKDIPAESAALADTATPYVTPVVTAITTETPASSLPPSPTVLSLEEAIILGYTQESIHVQFSDESAGDIRLAGIELDASIDAADYMEDSLPPGSIVYLENDTDGTDYYVWMEAPLLLSSGEVREMTLNALLAVQGYAMACADSRYADVLTACQEEAQTSCVGLWAVALETTAASSAPAPAAVSTPPPSPPEPSPSPPEETAQPPASIPEDPPAEPPGGVYYCGSKNSDVFHLSTCGSVSQISPENLVIYSSREDAIRRGKRPCKKCNP